jgi:hypothetical protein
MNIYVHKSTSNYDTVALGAPWGVATASAINDAVTYKAVDIPKLKIISFIILALRSAHQFIERSLTGVIFVGI